jgi:Holliday junction resolvasome RuvABC endonuclease subunit
MPTTDQPPIILGIDPGTRFLGFAVIAGANLRAFGVRVLRNGGNPYKVIEQARRTVLDLIREHGPSIVAIEEPLLVSNSRVALLQVIVQELSSRATELGLKLAVMSPPEARERLTGSPSADKIQVAEHLIAHGFPQLREKLPKRPARAVLGLKSSDKYWLHAFDALALAACHVGGRRGEG